MKGVWEEVLNMLPKQISRTLSCVKTDIPKEIRLRAERGIEVNYGNRQTFLSDRITTEDISYVLNAASQYSPWQTETISKGYLTSKGGHRIGICGETVVRQGNIQGIRNVDSICIRIARDVKAIGKEFEKCEHSILLLGPPGSGKTTLLRDIARTLAEKETVLVVDEREELFPAGFQRGKRMDILRLCPKVQGIEMVLKTMGPTWICVDEITTEEDCKAVLHAANCGVNLLATAHAKDINDLRSRAVYRALLEARFFENLVVLHKDNSFKWERKETWS